MNIKLLWQKLGVLASYINIIISKVYVFKYVHWKPNRVIAEKGPELFKVQSIR